MFKSNYYTETPPPQSTKENEETLVSPDPAAPDVRYNVAFQIGYSVPEVQAMFTQLEGRILRVWTIVPERQEDVYRKIYAKERALIEAFDGMEFEFNIIPSIGRNPKDVVSDSSCLLVFAR
jgi:hypothetical protein